MGQIYFNWLSLIISNQMHVEFHLLLTYPPLFIRVE